MMLAQKKECKDVIKWNTDEIGVAPTEGLPIKYVYHHETDVKGHDSGNTFACEKCCQEVIIFLKASGFQTDETCISDKCHTSSTSTLRYTKWDRADTSTSTMRLPPTDLLVLFEHELCTKKDFLKNMKFSKTLEKYGFSIKVKNKAGSEFLSKDHGHNLWITNATRDRGLKRKVVVYVEGPERLNIPLEWIRLRGITSCTSQLIWVKDVASSHPDEKPCINV